MLAIAMAVGLIGAATAAPAASAATGYDWLGAGASPNWSVAANWSGDQGLAANQSYATLGFVPNGSCVNSSSAATCFSSTDDVPVSVGQIVLDDNLPYKLSAAGSAQVKLTGNAPGGVASSSTGLSMSPGSEGYTGAKPLITIPIDVPADSAQTWAIGADSSGHHQSLEVDAITTASALDLTMTGGASFYTKSVAGAQPLGVSGGTLHFAGASGSDLDSGGTLSVTGGGGVELTTSGTIEGGSIDFADSSAGALSVGSGQAPDTLLNAGNVTLASTDSLTLALDSTCPTAGCAAPADNSAITSAGTVNLGGAKLVLDQGSDGNGLCDNLNVGQVYTLISAATLSGAPFSNFPADTPEPISELCGLGSHASPSYVKLHYGATSVTATVTAVGNAGDVPQNTALPVVTDKSTSSKSIVAGDKLAVSTGTWNDSGSTNPQAELSYSYDWVRCGSSCTAISGAHGSSYTSALSDAGDTIYAEVTATNKLGSKQVSSAKVGPLLSVINPAVKSAPKISGTTTLGSTISVTSSGSWTGRPAPSYRYQWLICSSSSPSSCIATGTLGSSKKLTLTAAELGRYVAVRVSASNRGGTALATSNLRGRVVPTSASVLAALTQLRHPSARRRAVRTLLRRRSFTTGFAAPSAGALEIVWRTRITVGRGRFRRHRVVTVAAGTATYNTLGVGRVTVHLTRSGRNQLRRHPRRLLITAGEAFEPLGGSWTDYTVRFTV